MKLFDLAQETINLWKSLPIPDGSGVCMHIKDWGDLPSIVSQGDLPLVIPVMNPGTSKRATFGDSPSAEQHWSFVHYVCLKSGQLGITQDIGAVGLNLINDYCTAANNSSILGDGSCQVDIAIGQFPSRFKLSDIEYDGFKVTITALNYN